MKRATLFFNLFVISLILLSCESEIEKQIPSSQLIGAVPNIALSIDAQKWKKHKEWEYIKAVGIVPFDIKREQVRPSLLSIIRTVRIQYPDCEWIWIELSPQDKMMGENGYFVGRAEYNKGQLKLYYGIPSEKQMEDWNSEIGKSYKDDILRGGIFVFDGPRLFRPDKETFDISYKISKRIFDLQWENRYNNKSYRPEGYKRAYQIVSKETSLSAKEVKRYFIYITKYYSFLGAGWGEETINLKR